MALTDIERAEVDAAAKGLTRAARNYAGVDPFVGALRAWTQHMTRGQLVALVARLATQLSNFYDADPMSEKGQFEEAELHRWLYGEL